LAIAKGESDTNLTPFKISNQKKKRLGVLRGSTGSSNSNFVIPINDGKKGITFSNNTNMFDALMMS
jgi:hypothetical protein